MVAAVGETERGWETALLVGGERTGVVEERVGAVREGRREWMPVGVMTGVVVREMTGAGNDVRVSCALAVLSSVVRVGAAAESMEKSAPW